MQRTVAEHAPLIASPVVCHTCGTFLKPQVMKSRRGVESIVYECHNEETGCSYRCETNVYLTAEVIPVRPETKKPAETK
jgi:hypothetical protein